MISHRFLVLFSKIEKVLGNFQKAKYFFEEKCKEIRYRMVKIIKNKKFKLFFLIFILPLFVILFWLLVIFFNIYKSVDYLQSSITDFKQAFQTKDFAWAEKEIVASENALEKLEISYNKLSVLGAAPFLGNYYHDGKAFISALENGFNILKIINNTLVTTTKDDTINIEEDSVNQYSFVLEYAPKIASKSGELKNEIASVQEKLDDINPEDYPRKFLGKNLRLHVEDLLVAVDNSMFLLIKGDGLIDKLPQFAGFDKERKYLLIFQNNKELRPTGGFITAYTIVNIRSGEFKISESNDIYNLDDRYEPVIPAPDPIVENLQGPYLETKNYRLRDMNWNPDFPISMQLFLQEISEVGINDIDGVIAIDTQVLVDIIDVIGEINVPGYGGYSNNIVELCDCEQIIYELEHFADREGPIVWSENEPGKIVEAPENYENRKEIIGPMMNTIVANIFNLRKTKYPALFNAVVKDLKEKHILIYMNDEVEEKAVKQFGAAGEIIDISGDYLYVNDTNLGGKKANLYVTNQVDQIISVNGDGSVEKTVKLTYRNPKPQNNWLNTVLPNYVRLYVPKGSELIDYTGFDYFSEPYEESGKTVFAGLLTVRPMGVTVVNLKYNLPFTVKDGYNLYLQKQPGKNLPIYSIEYLGKKNEFELDQDREIVINLK